MFECLPTLSSLHHKSKNQKTICLPRKTSVIFKFSLIAFFFFFRFSVTISSLSHLPGELFPLTDAATPISGADYTAGGGLLFEDHKGEEARGGGRGYL